MYNTITKEKKLSLERKSHLENGTLVVDFWQQLLLFSGLSVPVGQICHG
jgi:hypothetical protein